MAILCGIGFTMSLFVGSLAFVPGASEYAGMDRMGILTGSILAALIGYAVTAAASRKSTTPVFLSEKKNTLNDIQDSSYSHD